METVPARRGKATYLKQGRSIRIINTHGSQVVDTWAFNAHDLAEHPDVEPGTSGHLARAHRGPE